MNKLVFLGTGAAGGTPGKGKSNRLESSMLLKSDISILIDVTRHFNKQKRLLGRLDAVLLTHGHADACGGIPSLRGFTKKVPVLAHPKTIAVLQRRYKLLDHCLFVEVLEKSKVKIGDWQITAQIVPHAKADYSTFAWKLHSQDQTIIYASDIAKTTPEFKSFCEGSDILILDGAMWKKQIYTHLTIDKILPEICRWKVRKILLTQIGKTAPPHETLEKEVKKICPKTSPAFDGFIYSANNK